MKVLSGRELAEFIKQRQAHEVRSLYQSYGAVPKLAIIVTVEHPAIETYMRMKQRYGADIGVDVKVHRMNLTEVKNGSQALNADPNVHGIIVQLPLSDPVQTDEIVDLIDPIKDVDALGSRATLDPATPTAILWLLAGYNIDLAGKKIVLIGRGKLVGAPLERMLLASGYEVVVVDRSTKDLSVINQADVIVTATGQPGILSSVMIKPGAVVVDAGVAGEHGKTVGDLADDVRQRIDLKITPEKGGVGPLTICALFDNVLRTTRKQVTVSDSTEGAEPANYRAR